MSTTDSTGTCPSFQQKVVSEVLVYIAEKVFQLLLVSVLLMVLSALAVAVRSDADHSPASPLLADATCHDVIGFKVAGAADHALADAQGIVKLRLQTNFC